MSGSRAAELPDCVELSLSRVAWQAHFSRERQTGFPAPVRLHLPSHPPHLPIPSVPFPNVFMLTLILDSFTLNVLCSP